MDPKMMYKIPLLETELSVADGAVIGAFGLTEERKKTEIAKGLYVHRLDDPSAVRTRPRCWLPRHHPFIFPAHKH
ncbi:unnamed protein product [Sphenostylis stenocarpa]|uniref:Uncharacterized protein n=1 Tax=Sphenostylis stenocarpa TaxID=92480 RepID=A0AA86T4E1_9FABA|nr:unnamed protein product [Sphenostylis stenocarpa]